MRVGLYAVPCVVVWVLYVIAFYPGTMSPDSLDQWRQVVTGDFADYHPVFHTLLIWLITRVSESPAAVVLAQVLMLAGVFGSVMLQVERAGAPRWLRIAVTAWFTLMPVTGMMTVTLWKDVPYSICLLWLTGLLVPIITTQGSWLDKRSHQLLLLLVITLTALLRHNGILPAAGVLLALGIAFRTHWKPLAQVTAASLLLILLVKVPLIAALDARHAEPWQGLSMPVHQIAAMVKNDVALEPQDKELLNAIFPLELWAQRHAAYTVDPLVHDPKFSKQTLNERDWDVFGLWVRLVWQHPQIAAQDYAAMTSLLWSIEMPADGYQFSTQKGIERNTFGLASAHLNPWLETQLTNYVRSTEARERNWLFWRPALWLWVMLIAAAVAAYRFGRKSWLILLPVYCNVLGLLITVPAQDVRYMYAAMLTAPIAVCVACLQKNTPRPKQ